MINWFFVWGCMILMFITGIIVCRTFHVSDELLNRNGILLFPGIGILFLMGTVQILNILMPVSRLCYPYLLFMIWGLCKYREFIWRCLKTFVSNKRFLVLIAVLSLVWMIPLLGKRELVSIQIWNNDIIYYLSSMEWLKEHPSPASVSWNEESPFYWCAEYMLERTRIGFDGYGAFIMSLFGLKSHEVFSGLGIIFGITLLLHTYYLFSALCKLPGSLKVMAVILVALTGRVEELWIYQYLPQLFGISVLILFIPFSIAFFEEKTWAGRGMTAFLISGILTVYAEFCAYLLAIYVGFALIACKKGHRNAVKRGWVEGVIAILLNPAGTYRAIKINLFVLMNAGGDMGNIDPFQGRTLSVTELFTHMFGAFPMEDISDRWKGFYGFIWWIVIVCILLIWVYYVAKIKDSPKAYILYTAGFWWIYEIYFRCIRYGYGEYKHLISGTVLMLIFFCYTGYRFACSFPKVRTGKWMPGLIAVFLFICGGAKICGNLYNKEFYYFDHSLTELEEAGRLVPGDEAIGISGTPASVHGAVYALRNRSAVILTNNISYYPYSEEASGRYQLFEGDYREREKGLNEEFLWGNGRFYLIRNTSLQTVFYTGFHLTDTLGDVDERYTCDKESSVMIYNHSKEPKCFSVAFQTEAAMAQKESVTLMVNGETVASGRAGDYIMTDMLMLDPDKKLRIYIYYDGKMEEMGGKTVGFCIKDLKLVTYGDE